MENNKTEVLSFDIDEYNYRECQAHNHGFYLGEQSKQVEVDKLQKRVKELELINFDSELHFDAAKEHIYHLQKRIDDALIELEEAYRKGIIEKPRCIVDSIKILKGEKQ